MGTMTYLHSSAIKTVAVVGSAYYERIFPHWIQKLIQKHGFKVIVVPDELRTKEEIIAFIREHAQAAICGQRLWFPDETLTGAELAAALYDCQIPAIMITRYKTLDHFSILPWKEKVPLVFHPRDHYLINLKEQFAYCLDEIHGFLAEERIPYRIMAEIIDIVECDGQKYVDICADRWKSYQIVRFPLAMLPDELQSVLEPHKWLFVETNVEAREVQDLYFRGFALAPTPLFDENLTYYINMLDKTGNDSFRDHEARAIFEAIGYCPYTSLPDPILDPQDGIQNLK